jgi:outer membrane lipoprotein-sorting protein
MKFFNKILLGTLVVGTFAFSYAQKIDAKAKTILDAVSANYKAKKNTYYKFSYGTGKGSVTKTETGIFYATPTQYKLNIMGNEQIFDGKKVYNISKEDQEVTIAKPNGSEKALSPTNYIDEYKSGYTVTYTGKNGALDIIKMVPVKDNGIKNILLYINTAKKQVAKIVQNSAGNDVAVITVVQYKENQKLSNSTFSFDKNKYKNYLITEL